jgi:hypothetical protein
MLVIDVESPIRKVLVDRIITVVVETIADLLGWLGCITLAQSFRSTRTQPLTSLIRTQGRRRIEGRNDVTNAHARLRNTLLERLIRLCINAKLTFVILGARQLITAAYATEGPLLRTKEKATRFAVSTTQATFRMGGAWPA